MGGSEEDSTAQRANTAEEAASTDAPRAGMKRVACDEEQGGAAGVKQARTVAEATEQAGDAAGGARTAQPSSAPEPAPAPAATHNNTDKTNNQTEASAAATTTQATAAAPEVTTASAAEPAGTAGNDAATPQIHPPVERSASPSAQPPAATSPGLGAATTAAATATATAAGATAASSAATATASALAAAYSEDKGCRTAMEDVCVLQLDARPPGGPECRLAFFGVFDGHGGVACATAASQQLHSRVLEAGLLGKGLLAGGKTDAKACKAAVAERSRRRNAPSESSFV